MISVLFGIIIVLYIIHLSLHHNYRGKTLNKIPGPKTLPIIGTVFNYFMGQVAIFYYMRKLTSEYDGIFRMWIGKTAIVNIFNPQDVEIVLSSSKHIEKNHSYEFLHPWLNNGLLLSSGEKWFKRRKILTPTFHFNILKQFTKIFVEHSEKLVEELKKVTGEEINIMPHITKYTLHTICETAMGMRLDSKQNFSIGYKNAIYDIGKNLIYRISKPWLRINFLFKLSQTWVEQKKILNILHNFTIKVIKLRRKEKKLFNSGNSDENLSEDEKFYSKKKLAMLDLLLQAESNNEIDELGIREEVDTFMFEGHDTTAVAIGFCLILLANNPESQKLVYEEITNISESSDDTMSFDELNKMNYLERCIKETLRMFPSVPIIGRHIKEDLKLTKYTIPANASCNILIFALHRDPDIYPNPEKFDPDRFLLENCAKRHPFAFVPFSAGSRNCIGQRYAILEIKAVICVILKNFILEPVTRPQDIIFSGDLVLRSQNILKVKFVPRYS